MTRRVRCQPTGQRSGIRRASADLLRAPVACGGGVCIMGPHNHAPCSPWRESHREETMRRTTAAATVAISVMLGVGPFPAHARPFDDPRSDRIPALDQDAAFAAEPRDPACHDPVL